MKKVLCSLLMVSVFATSCTKYAYYQSPLQNNTNTYKEIPLHNDTISSAFYASGTFSMTQANMYRDGYAAFLGALHRAHKFSAFQSYYGATVVIGNYKVGSVSQGEPSGGIIDTYNYGLNDSIITANSGSKFFGSVGVMGGINYVQSWPRREWRILGVGFAVNNEFGRYLDFRNSVPDSAANLLDHNKRSLNILFTTDYVAKTREGNAGFQLGYVINPKKMAGQGLKGDPKIYQSGYVSSTLHITVQKLTSFLQWNVGNFTSGLQLGANYRLGR